MAWLWLVFWSSAFTLRDEDHVRFTILYDTARPKVRRIYMLITAACIVGALLISMPATYDYVSFMKIEKSSLLKVRFDVVFSVYLIFAVAIITRYVWRVVEMFRTPDEDTQT